MLFPTLSVINKGKLGLISLEANKYLPSNVPSTVRYPSFMTRMVSIVRGETTYKFIFVLHYF